jgi:hypothetical protein
MGQIGESAFRWTGLRSIEIPSSVVVLGKESVYGCKSLESIGFESGSRLERIEESAFCWTGFHSIEIPSSVVVLGKESFCVCKSLESVTFESDSRLERIEESAFRCAGLQSIEIPSSVVVLGKESFCLCKSLESVTFESGSRLERIEESAFSETGLKSIEIPGSVAFIDGSSFAGLSLISVSVCPDSVRFRVRECFLVDFDGSTIYQSFGSWRSIVIPSCVVVLGYRSFSACQSLESVRFESRPRLERIGESAFRESGLESIEIPSSVVFWAHSVSVGVNHLSR